MLTEKLRDKKKKKLYSWDEKKTGIREVGTVMQDSQKETHKKAKRGCVKVICSTWQHQGMDTSSQHTTHCCHGDRLQGQQWGGRILLYTDKFHFWQLKCDAFSSLVSAWGNWMWYELIFHSRQNYHCCTVLSVSGGFHSVALENINQNLSKTFFVASPWGNGGECLSCREWTWIKT